MNNKNLKPKTGNKKYFGIFSTPYTLHLTSVAKKLVPGLILFSFVLSGILAPVSVVKVLNDSKEAYINISSNKALAVESDTSGGDESGGRYGSDDPPSDGSDSDKSPFSCGITNLLGCAGHIIYGLLYIPASWVLFLSGWMLDVTLAFSLSKNVLDAAFAKSGWMVTRDLANMFFIFILLYIAIATILNIAQYNAKALLARLVIVALLLNFSLFATRVVIDASNVLALAFYNSIGVTVRSEKGDPSSFVKGLSVTPKGISSGLVGSFDPQQLLGVSGPNAKSIADFAKNDPGKLIFIYIFTSAIILTTAWAFFSIAFLFITRVAILWFLMATAPIAFAAIILPKTREIFNKWWGELMSKSFCVAVFLFFLWLIIMFVQDPFLGKLLNEAGGIGGNLATNFVTVMLMVLLNFSIILVLILVAKQQTQKMCGAVAGFSMNFVSGLGTKAAGFLAGGVGGRLLRGTLGGAAFDLAESRKEKWGSGNVFQRLALQGARKVSGASFDVRGTKLGGTAELGKASGKGGYKGAIDKRVREDTAWAKSFGEGEKADRAREAFVGKLNEMSGDSAKGILGRIITGRGILSKVEPEKAAKAIKKTIYATEKAKEEEVELKEMKNKVLEEQPAEVKDEKGNLVYAYKNMNDIEAAVKSNALSQIDSERIVKEAIGGYGKSLKEKLSNAKVDLKGFETSGNAQGAARMTSEIEKLTEAARSLEKMDKLENRIENRNQRKVDKQEREDAQKSSSGEGNKDKK